MKRIIVSMAVLGMVTSCNHSTLSTEKITDISCIGAQINIIQHPYNKQENELKIILFDKNNNVISNDSIHLFVNHLPLELNKRQGLYYNEESYYTSLKNVPVDNNYYVARIKLSDGKEYLLGSIRALKEEKIGNINCDEQGDLTKDVIIKWQHFNSMDELATRTSFIKTSATKETSYIPGPEKIKHIGKSGIFRISTSDYRDSTSVISNLGIQFRTTKSGTMNPKLLATSSITVSASIEKTVRFEE